jgi:hypothetical protein
MAQKNDDAQVSVANAGSDVKSDDKSANLPPSTPPELRALAEDLPEKDPVQKAHKKALTAEDPAVEAKAKAEVSKESPNSSETPSGHALEKVAGISNDTERGEKYAREKAAVRHGWTPVD